MGQKHDLTFPMTNLIVRIMRRLTIMTLLWACLSSLMAAEPKQILFFTKSSGFEHGPIRRTNGELSHAEKILTELGKKHDFAVTCTKDGGVFTPENIAKYDAFCFYTTGDLTSPGTDKQPPMSKAGKAAFLEAIRNGKGFIGTHSASDTFHTNEPDGTENKSRAQRYKLYGEEADPYIRMLGAEFIIHGAQQKSTMRVVDKHFPGLSDHG